MAFDFFKIYLKSTIPILSTLTLLEIGIGYNLLSKLYVILIILGLTISLFSIIFIKDTIFKNNVKNSNQT